MAAKPIDLNLHDIAFKKTFVRQWDEYWKLRPTLIPPGSPAELVRFLRGCYQLKADEVGYEVWPGRHPFRHPDMPETVLYAVLEGVTRDTPVGVVTFLGMRETPRQSPFDFTAGVVYRIPPTHIGPGEQVKWLKNQISRCREWLRRAGPDNPQNAVTEATLARYLELHDEMAPEAATVADMRAQIDRLTAQMTALAAAQAKPTKE